MGDGDSRERPISPPDTDSIPDEESGSDQSGISEFTEEDVESAPDTTESSEQPSGGAGGGGAPAGVGIPQNPEQTERADDSGAAEADPGDESETPEQPDIDQETDDSDDEDHDDEDEEQIAWIVQHSDSWDDMGWGLSPIILQLKEEYRDQMRFDIRTVPVREFQAPEEIVDTWESNADRHGMPVDTSIWSSDPPGSTALSNQAFAAAREQGIETAKDYIRRLRRAAIVEGRNIEDQAVLMELADEVGLDTDTLSEDWDDVEIEATESQVETPQTTIHVDGTTIRYNGYFHPDDVRMMFEQAGFEQHDPRPLSDFVAEYGPVTTKEVMEIYGLERDVAVRELRDEETIASTSNGEASFWTNEED